MKTNQSKKTITINLQEFGMKYEVTCPLFFVKLQEKTGLDLKTPLAKHFQMKIANLQKAAELGALTKEGKINLENYKTGEQILATC